jgi:RNA polymerase sigma-70 factor (ECF subfamily)
MRIEARYEELRPLLFSIAYRMISSVSEAEDIVQEAFLRIHRAEAEGTRIESPKAYLSAVTTRLSIDHLKSARVRREQYVGQWLPEPLITDDSAPDAAAHAETADSLSLAFLVLLESLTPVERAVFLLREVFDYGYDEIARIVDRTEDNCRQLYVRARRHVDEGRPRFEASRKQRDELVERFFAAAERGDLAALEEMLAADVVVYGDGGGKAPSWPKPIVGRGRVAKLIAGTLTQAKEVGVRFRAAHINGQPGVMFVDDEDRIGAVMSVDVADGLVQTIRGVTNPTSSRISARCSTRARFCARTAASGEEPWAHRPVRSRGPPGRAPAAEQQRRADASLFPSSRSVSACRIIGSTDAQTLRPRRRDRASAGACDCSARGARPLRRGGCEDR